MTPPVLAIFNRNRETELHTDASAVGFGAVLMQKQEVNAMHPVYFYSKAASADESRCHSFELETLAIVYALDRFRSYLHGIPFKVVTDCNALSLTFDKKSICPKIARWALALQHFNFRIQHRSGVMMGHADALSRCYQTDETEPVDYHSDIMSRIVSICAASKDETTDAIDELIEDTDDDDMFRKIPCKTVKVADQMELNFLIQITQNRDASIVKLRERLEQETIVNYELKDGLVYRRDRMNRLQLYVPEEMEENVIRMIHEKICHLGIGKTHDEIRKNYWFENMKEKVDKFVKNCIRCIMCSPPARVNEHHLYNIPKKPIPFDTIYVDHLGPLPAVNSVRKHLLVVIDAFTKFVKLFPCKSTSTKEVIASLDKYFAMYSRPRRIISDRGTCFTSLDFGEYLLRQNVDHVKVAVAPPQANGQVERVNRVITPMFSKAADSISHADWVRMISQVEFALNNSTHSSTKHTPSQLLFGVDQRGEIFDHMTEYLQDKCSDETRRDLDGIRHDASDSIRRSQENNSTYFAKKNKPPKTFSEGDFVVIRYVDTTAGVNKKLNERYRGPYVVHKVLSNDRYVVRDVDNCQVTRIPYDGVLEARNMRKWIEP